MDSATTHKILKARQYASEPGRVRIHEMKASLEGDDRDHRLEFVVGRWACDCEYFRGHRFCAHTMAMERLLDGMLAPVA